MSTMIRKSAMARRRSFRAALAGYLEALAAGHDAGRRTSRNVAMYPDASLWREDPQQAQAMSSLYWSRKALS